MVPQTGEQQSLPPNIMVISDAPDLLLLFTYALRDQGYEVRGIKDGLEGIEQCIAAPPDILIVQYHMDTIDAVQICRRVRSDPKVSKLPILVFQVFRERDFQPTLLAGATACFGYPFDIGDILAQITAICTKGRQ
jgi:DNA-binding response OmpR family regulator